jgi:hypothetical protein
MSLARYISSVRLQPNVTTQAQNRRLKKIGGDWVQLPVVDPQRSPVLPRNGHSRKRRRPFTVSASLFNEHGRRQSDFGHLKPSTEVTG